MLERFPVILNSYNRVKKGRNRATAVYKIGNNRHEEATPTTTTPYQRTPGYVGGASVNPRAAVFLGSIRMG